jgi:hypothetical protein
VVREKFFPPNLPPEESAADYDAQGRVKLPPEFADWLAGDGVAQGGVFAEPSRGGLRVVFPPVGSRFFLDPDLPDSGRAITLRAAGGLAPVWRCASLELRESARGTEARLAPGRHEFTVADTGSGATARTWIEVVE